MKNSNTAKFVTLEGIEGVGKSTHIKNICQFLDEKHIDYLVTHEPGKTDMGKAIRDLLLKDKQTIQATTELLLMFADRAEHVCHVIQPALAQGKWVVSDRFFDSSLAYQGGGRKLPQQLIQNLIQAVCGDTYPDLTFLFYTDLDTIRQRLAVRSKTDRFEQESDQFFNRVQQAYFQLAEKEPQRWVKIDTGSDLQLTKNHVFKSLEKLLKA